MFSTLLDYFAFEKGFALHKQLSGRNILKALELYLDRQMDHSLGGATSQCLDSRIKVDKLLTYYKGG